MPDREFAVQNDPISPSHYKFPNGAEVIDVSQYLTSCGGQAYQYIARATRIDGKVKGDPIEDLEKAVWFAQRELARLKRERAEVRARSSMSWNTWTPYNYVLPKLAAWMKRSMT